MDQFHGRSMRNARGGKRRRNRDKRKYECGGYFSAPKISEKRATEKRRGRGGNAKIKVKGISCVNVSIDKGRVARVKMLKVASTQDNRNYARQGYITKGSIVSTEMGDVMIANRPTKDGVVNAVLLKK